MWGDRNKVGGFSDLDEQEVAAPTEAVAPPVSDEQQPSALVTHLVRYQVTLDDIRRKGEEYAALTFDTPADYETGRKAIQVLRETRVGIDARRTELNVEALAHQRRVNAMAKELIAAIEAIEEPLKAKKQAVDDEKARVKREAEEARLRAEREAEEKRLAEERRKLEAERAELAERQRQADEAARVERERVEALQAAERARLDQEAAKLKAEREAQAEAARLEREQLEADRRAIDEAKRKAERAEAERQARIRAEAEAAEQAERDRIAAEEARVAELERQAAIAKRIEALKPDAEKVAAFAASIRAWMNGVTVPEFSSNIAANVVRHAILSIEKIADEVETDFANESRFAAEDAVALPMEAP
jgi:chromosome segregation ATPase